ncbi:hypothetical protein IGJ27_001708 [Enterococcus sp. DIV1726a]
MIIQNPTITATPEKSDYEPKKFESDGSVDERTTKEANQFLETFFKLYPKIAKEELAYYVKNEALKPIQKDFFFRN